MDRLGFKGVSFFRGTEVEKNSALGSETLFVVGLHSPSQIKGYVTDLPRHIYFGANDSFYLKNEQEIEHWVDMISHFIDLGCLCTLDVPCESVLALSQTKLIQSDFFQPILKLAIPNIEKWTSRTHVKLDDIDFASTNKGVWVHQLSDLMTAKSFTSWQEFDGDTP